MSSMRIRYLLLVAVIVAFYIHNHKSKNRDDSGVSVNSAPKVAPNKTIANRQKLVSAAPKHQQTGPSPEAEAYENPLYKDPEKYADPQAIEARDEEERSIHELQHSVEIKNNYSSDSDE